ncbi:hypothetical protein WJX73_007267 [Symbiochloris irregularis]|uniref:Glycosyltransferase 61 catalytic domain-containing protein n=1 Tax=Symbiochloris irregularis TaxID=706552 RepID=A0AAW1PZ70_9CHLO
MIARTTVGGWKLWFAAAGALLICTSTFLLFRSCFEWHWPYLSHHDGSTCRTYGRVHMCRFRDVFYQGGSLAAHWENPGPGGTTLPFQVAQSLGNRSAALVPPCSFSTISAPPGCTENKFQFRQKPSRGPAKNCTANDTVFRDPVILVYRSYINTMHFLNDQAIPFYLTLAEWGLLDHPVQVVAMDDGRYSLWHASPEYLQARDQVWEQVAGRPIMNWWANINDSFCAPEIIVGDPGDVLRNFDRLLPTDTVLDSRDKYQAFVHWMLGRFNLSHPTPEQRRQQRPVVTLIDRSNSSMRRILNQDQILQAARGWPAEVRGVKLEQLDFASQLETVVNSDVIMGMHGAGLGLLAFLPPWGVVVEMHPYGVGPGLIQDFYPGFCNWARLMGLSHMAWHVQNRTTSVPDPQSDLPSYSKNHHTLLHVDDMLHLVSAAANLSQTPLHGRDLDECIQMNKPVHPDYDSVRDYGTLEALGLSRSTARWRHWG